MYCCRNVLDQYFNSMFIFQNISIYMALQNPFSTAKVVRVFKRNLHQLLFFSVLSAESSVFALANQVIGQSNKTIFKDAYRRAIATPKGYFGYLLINFFVHNPIVQKFRMRNVYCSFPDSEPKFKSLFRSDVCLYELN
jgi:hypothetical protein